MIKSISFIVLTQFFNFNELKIKATTYFFKLNQNIFFTVWKNLQLQQTTLIKHK